jgi:hypothetical protein
VLETRQVEEARNNPNFYVYVVENVRQGSPEEFTLKILGGDRLARLLERQGEAVLRGPLAGGRLRSAER